MCSVYDYSPILIQLNLSYIYYDCSKIEPLLPKLGFFKKFFDQLRHAYSSSFGDKFHLANS